jgi:hypothetical protein
VRSLLIASTAAFAGGVAVVGVQYGLGEVSAGYPPLVQALLCGPEGKRPAAALGLAEQGGTTLPVVEVAAGTSLECHLEAPGADYAIWSVVGPRFGTRSGPLDPAMPCQTPEDFAAQNTAQLRLSACQRVRFAHPGSYTVLVTVMVRGHPFVDRTMLSVRVAPAKAEPPSPPPTQTSVPVSIRIIPALRLPERNIETQRTAELSASFKEHGILPQSRNFTRTAYRLAADEEFVSTDFRARSAANASAVQLAYVPRMRAITASFTLRSGPIIDRWTGWVSGTVVIRVRRSQKAQQIALSEVTVDVPGRVSVTLPDDVETDGARIVLRPPDTENGIEVAPDGSARFDHALVTARFVEDSLLLEATPN